MKSKSNLFLFLVILIKCKCIVFIKWEVEKFCSLFFFLIVLNCMLIKDIVIFVIVFEEVIYNKGDGLIGKVFVNKNNDMSLFLEFIVVVVED